MCCVLQFLWPLQRFSHSRGQQLLLDKGLPLAIDFEHYEQDEPQPNNNIYFTTTLPTLPTLTEATDSASSKISSLEKDSLQSSHALNARLQATKSYSNDITYEWHAGEWSNCDITCGLTTTQMQERQVTCVRQVANVSNSQLVDLSYCQQHASEVEPVARQRCQTTTSRKTFISCPQWRTGPWTLCQQSRCLGRHLALQRRDVRCQFVENATDTVGCLPQHKPISRKECYNERCKGVWRVEPWSECNAACGHTGIKYRILQCVWFGTRRPAGNACKHQPRPAVMKACKRPPCQSLMTSVLRQECEDMTRYCRNVRSIGLCRLHRYQQHCCKSCKLNIFD